VGDKARSGLLVSVSWRAPAAADVRENRMTKTNYTAPGFTLVQIEDILAQTIYGATYYSTAVTADATRIDQAITAAGMAVETWNGKTWWWQDDMAYFQTATKSIVTTTDSGASRSSNVVTITTTAVHGLETGQFVKIVDVASTTFNGTFEVASTPSTTTFTYSQVDDDETSEEGSVYVISYPIRDIDVTGAVVTSSEVAIDFWAAQKVYYNDDWSLRPIPPKVMRRKHITLATATSTKPFEYSVVARKELSTGSGDRPYLWLWPAPDDAYDMFVDYTKRHSKITGGSSGSNDMELLVPAEFQTGIYIDGAQWLLSHDVHDSAPLKECPGWMDAIDRMTAAAPRLYDADRNEDMFPDTVGTLPHDRRIMPLSDGGYLIQNDVSV